MYRITVSLLVSLFVYSHAVASGVGEKILTASSSSTTSQLLPPEAQNNAHKGEVLIYTLPEQLEKLNALTPETLDDGVELFPSALLFKINHYIETHPKLTQSDRGDLTEHLVFSTLFFLEMVEVTEFSRDAIDLVISLIKKLDAKKLPKQKANLLKKSFRNAAKVKTLKTSDIYKAFFPNSMPLIQDCFQHLKCILATHCNVQISGKSSPFFTESVVRENRKALEQGVNFDVVTSKAKFWQEMLAAQLNPEGPEYLNSIRLLRFSRLQNTAHNYAASQYKQGNLFEAQRWKNFADPHAKPDVINLDAEASEAFFKSFWGERGAEAFFETATKTTLTPEEHLEKIKTLVEAENPLPENILLYAQKLYDAGKFTKAKEWGIKAGEAGKEKGYLIAADCAAMCQHSQDIVTYLNKITDASLITPHYHFGWGQALYLLKKNTDEARLHFTHALRDFPEAYFFLAELESDTQKKERLYLISLQKMDKNNLNIFTAHQRLGLLYEEQGHFEKARKQFQQAIDKGDIGISFFMGRSYFREENFTEAIPYFIAAAKSKTQKNKWVKGESFVYAANCCLKLEQIEQAQLFYKKAVKAGAYYALLDLGKIAEAQGDNESALNYYDRAVNKQVKKAHHHLVLLYAKIGQMNTSQLDYVIADLFEDNDEDDIEINVDNTPDDNEYVEVINSKKYQRMLARIEKDLAEETQKSPEERRTSNEKSLDDLNVTCSSCAVENEIHAHETRVKDLLYSLANGIKAGKLEPLKDYSNRYSMRITKGDRLVFDIVEGSLNDEQGIKAIVIVSAKGHYKNVTDTEYDAPTDIKVEWIEENQELYDDQKNS